MLHILNKKIDKSEPKTKMLKEGIEKITQETIEALDPNTHKIKLLSTNPYFYKTYNNKGVYISVFINQNTEQYYYKLFTINKNTYYINMVALDKIDNLEEFKTNVIEDVCFYKTVVIDNYLVSLFSCHLLLH